MNNNQTWPCTSSSSPFTSFPLPSSSRSIRLCSSSSSSSSSTTSSTDFSSLPYDILTKISASFDHPNLESASLVCRSWCEALRPLREAMVMLMWGKRLKHGKRGVRKNTEKALEMFTKAAAKGSALAMVDAGLIHWEKGEKDKALDFYLMAAHLGNASAQCNLGISYLQVEPPNTEQALKWLYKASEGGNIRAQYQLALCLHRAGGNRSNIREAVKWYTKAAEGGYMRAMYNISLCYSFGEGLARNHQIARKWMKRLISTMSPSPSQIFITFLIFLFHFQHTSSFTLSVENPKQNIILSPKKTFTAGFYPVGQNAYSFAIWFTQKHKNLNNTTIVWMANRDQPVNGKRSTLSLLKTGNLVLTDAAQSIVWSTDTTSTKPLELILHETGNLVLQEQNTNGSRKRNILWQSFDFPTDTLLPDQTLTRFTNLVSSRSQTNYSSGFYKLFFDNDNVLRLLYQGPRVSSIYWPDPWTTSNGAAGSGTRSTYNSSRIASLDSFGSFSSSDDFVFNTADYGTFLQRRLTLDHDGNVRIYSRKDEEQGWFVSGQFRQQPCFIHGICGPNSTCSNDPLTGRKCSCLPGYVWINDQDSSQGCRPNFELSCSNKTHDELSFLALSHVDFYGYDYGFYTNKTYKECETLCAQLCDCAGFQYTFTAEYGGVYWCYPKIQLLNGHRSQSFLGSFYLKLPKSGGFVDEIRIQQNSSGMVCERNGVVKLDREYIKKKENGSLKFMLWFAGGLGGVELLGFFMVWFFLFRSSKNSDENHDYVLAATGFRKFSYSELKQATKGFSQEIGRGAGGTVYKGVLSDNRVAAIKRLHEANEGESESEFLAEVSIIGRLNHMNLIGMWGYCAEGKHRLLVYEYMENGTLADNLSSNELDWGKRYNIAMGTAKGLAYLHEECLEWILHCDIKPQNILVDSDYQPKVADFGLSKLLNRDDLDNSNFSRIRGTRGYMAPEWVFNMQITSKVDVYSYGVVVLEMITGKSPTTGIQIKDKEELCHERLVTWVREKRRKGLEVGCWVEQIVDPKLGSNYDVKKMETLANVALDCVQEDKDVRPTMSQVVERLLRDEQNY